VKLTSLNSDPGIVHMASNVCENLGLESELADGLAISAGLLRCSGRGELDILDTECIESLRDGDLGLRIEESIGELLALCTTSQTRGQRRKF
jgi:hypothetical protein